MEERKCPRATSQNGAPVLFLFFEGCRLWLRPNYEETPAELTFRAFSRPKWRGCSPFFSYCSIQISKFASECARLARRRGRSQEASAEVRLTPGLDLNLWEDRENLRFLPHPGPQFSMYPPGELSRFPACVPPLGGGECARVWRDGRSPRRSTRVPRTPHQLLLSVRPCYGTWVKPWVA